MSPHTPGPWEIDDGAMGATPEEPFTQPGALGVFGEDGQRICYLSEDAEHPDGLRGRDEDEANARLIAAAPAMLDALLGSWEHNDAAGRTFLCNCPAYGKLSVDASKDRDGLHATACNDARAAIAKARNA